MTGPSFFESCMVLKIFSHLSVGNLGRLVVSCSEVTSGQNPFRARGGELVYLGCLVRRLRETRQTRAPTIETASESPSPPLRQLMDNSRGRCLTLHSPAAIGGLVKSAKDSRDISFLPVSWVSERPWASVFVQFFCFIDQFGRDLGTLAVPLS